MLPKNPNAAPEPPGAGEEPVTLQPTQQAESYQPGPTRSPFLTPGSLLVLGVFAVGIAGIYALSLRIGPSKALGGQNLMHAKVEAALNVLDAVPAVTDAERTNSAKAIVGEFYTAAKQRQVSVRGLKGNPFVFVDPRPPAPAPAPAPKPEEVKKPEEDGKQQALAEIKRLKLQTIMVGPNSTMALVSSNLVTTGQTIGGWKVERITPRQVHLSWKDMTHVMEIEQ